jgi:hypothetical protein
VPLAGADIDSVPPAPAQPKEFPLPVAAPTSAAPAPNVPLPLPLPSPPPGLPLPSLVDPGYFMYEDNPDYGEPSRTRFFPGLVTGVLVSAVVAAILLFAYGNQAAALLTRWKAATTPTPSAPAASPPLQSASLPQPPISTESPVPDGSAEAAAPVAPALNSATAPAATPLPIADNPVTPAPDDPPPPVADPGENDLANAQRYLNGKAGPVNNVAAAHFLWSAVQKGNVQAEVELADMYARGAGVTKSCEQARVLFRAAAEKGSSQGAEKLAQILRGGCR